jgi:hypothetical protein
LVRERVGAEKINLLLLHAETAPYGSFLQGSFLIFEAFLPKRAIGELLRVRQNATKGVTLSLTKHALSHYAA